MQPFRLLLTASALGIAECQGQDLKKVRFTEIMYHPPKGQVVDQKASELAYIELTNFGKEAVNLGGALVRGIDFNFTSGSILPAEKSGVLVKNRLAFETRYSSPEIFLGEWSGSLKEKGEELVLEKAGQDFSKVSFDSKAGWPILPDGHGHSLVVVDRGAAQNGPSPPSAWRSSNCKYGSPGLNDNDAPKDCEVAVVGCSSKQDTLSCQNEGKCKVTHERDAVKDSLFCQCGKCFSGDTCEEEVCKESNIFSGEYAGFIWGGVGTILLLIVCAFVYVYRKHRQSHNEQLRMHLQVANEVADIDAAASYAGDTGTRVRSTSTLSSKAKSYLRDSFLNESEQTKTWCEVCQTTEHSNSECPF